MADFLDDLLGDAPAAETATATAVADSPKPTPAAAASPAGTTKPAKTSRKSQPLFFDLETVPDLSRIDLYDLPEIPQPAEYIPLNDGPTQSELVRDTLENTKAAVAAAIKKHDGKKICREMVLACIDTENKAQKARKGVLELFGDMLAAIDGEADAIAAAIEQRNKTMSVTPEMCKIVAMGWAIGEDPITSLVVGMDHADGSGPITEADILTRFWSLLGNCGPVCGYNILGFDLPTIFVRSAMLDVKPRKKLDLRPWGNDAIDLMACRFQKSGAKSLDWMIRVNEITSEVPDVDGSKVLALYEKGELARIGEYVRDDVSIERALWRKYLGFFW